MSASPRTSRRRLQRAVDEADRMVQADEKFFRRFPHRAHRVRLASRAEMEANRLAGDLKAVPTDPGKSWFCAVKRISPSVRVRVFLQNDTGTDCDLSEWQAEFVFSLVAAPGSQAQLIERQIEAVIAKRGRL